MRSSNILALSAAALLAIANLGIAQTAVVSSSTSTTTSEGTISDFSPDTIVIRSESSPEPMRYSYSKTTTYVDDAGAPVSHEIVKSGLPVTVHYSKEGDRVVASRVIVHRHKTLPTATVERTTTTTAVPAPIVEEKSSSSTTTTTTNSKHD